MIYINRRGIGDLDSWWHTLIGDQIRAGVHISQWGDSWSLYDDGHAWRSSQWLTELLFSILHSLFGWSGLIVFRNVIGVTLLLWLSRVVLRGRSFRIAFPILVLSTFMIAPLIQERPALLGLLFTFGIGCASTEILETGNISSKHWWWIPTTTLWANFHGSWVLAPAIFSITALALLVSIRTHRLRKAFPRSLILLIGGSILAGCITPLGVHGLFLPFTMADRASAFIIEWHRTRLFDGLTAPLAILLALILMMLIIRRSKSDLDLVIVVIFWSIFAVLAFRNIGPAFLIILPNALQRFLPPSSRHVSRTHWAIPPAFILIAVLVVDPISTTSLREIGNYLKDSKITYRILNSYNASGPLLAFGGNHISLMVDGRADRYPKEWMADYLVAARNGIQVEKYVDTYDLNAAVVERASMAANVFRYRLKWNEKVTEERYILFTRP